jgi:hypothetical protein
LAYVKGALELAQEQKARNIQEHQERQQNYTTTKQIENLLNQKVVGKDTRNLDLFLKERNWTANTAPDNWSKPVKQTVLREKIGGNNKDPYGLITDNFRYGEPPKSKRPNPIRTPSVIIESNSPEIVIPEYTDLNIITPNIKSPSVKMKPTKTIIENPMALYAILIGAGISGIYLMTHLGKKRGRK